MSSSREDLFLNISIVSGTWWGGGLETYNLCPRSLSLHTKFSQVTHTSIRQEVENEKTDENGQQYVGIGDSGNQTKSFIIKLHNSKLYLIRHGKSNFHNTMSMGQLHFFFILTE